MKQLKTRLFLISTLLVLGACSSAPTVTELANTAEPNAEIARVEANITQARINQVDVLSPRNFELATDTMDKAKEARGNGKGQKKILHQIALSQAYLDRANASAKVAGQILSGVAVERKNALAADAPKYFSKEFTDADGDLKNATRDIEGNNTSTAEETRGGLEKRYNSLELLSIRKAKLGDAQSNVEQAISEGANKLAPQTLAWTQKKISEDDALITANRHDVTVVEKASTDAKAASVRLTNIVRQAKSSSQQNPEQLAIQLEKKQTSADEAAAVSGAKLGASEKKLAQSNADIDSKNGSLAVLSAENDKLESEGQFEKKYESARQQFSKNEAEVYKQGDKLLLRLKGLSFPKDQSVITANNYALLAKVQKVMKDVGTSTIAIEGHTDSTGSKATNEKLSSARAEAVQDYLKANNFIESDKISAHGFGDTKPIATNKTSVGRAQNRRVDVIITSEKEM